jgi:hypothetical protein
VLQIFSNNFLMAMEIIAWVPAIVGRWVKHFKDGKRDTGHLPRSGRPRTATTEYELKVDALTTDDRLVTVREIIGQLSIG